MPLDRTCDECGTAFVAKTKRARFCGAACRVRANRRPSKVGAAAAKRADTATPSDAPKTESKTESLTAQVRRTLERFDALDTVSGLNAVLIAGQLDRGDDSGSAMATLSKELSRLVAEAKAEALPKHRDGTDDVLARVAEKLMGLAAS